MVRADSQQLGGSVVGPKRGLHVIEQVCLPRLRIANHLIIEHRHQ